VKALVEQLQNEGFSEDEIQGLMEAELFYSVAEKKR